MITVIGSLNYDFVTFTSRVHCPGETVLGDAFEQHLGGKGLNETIATARLSPACSKMVRLWGKVGNDLFGEQMISALNDAGVCTSLVSVVPGVSSGSATIIVEHDGGENRIIVIGGANSTLKPTEEEYKAAFKDSAAGDYAIIQNEYPDPIGSIRWLRKNKPEIKIVYNPSPMKPDWVSIEILNMVDYLVVNQGEAKDLWELLKDDKLNLQESVRDFAKFVLQDLQELLSRPDIVITLGGEGCIFTNEKNTVYIPSVKVTSLVDTTGAGDTFLGGFVSQLHSGKSAKDAIEFASVASSMAIQHRGAAESIPVYEQVQKQY
ncbi:hypothetical protein FOA43_001683 [Brettanomyces nanus]|uniref:Ribokinase n=1 Tax=Eeniella nana TaxID=13502 RepID=A0A875RYW9_EENNA|nr:uncharacterized protein FOA43_001683 [Brettanomyces nanus]QPG74356.1 hypothetical protein FOA43_001683 [Brettanomyces nanus]